ncbi:MAG: hypothetical protein M5U26_17440 [Planctomycetota bacterium]|nr:hypothetical protein [Planctomycetota bacterium]
MNEPADDLRSLDGERYLRLLDPSGDHAPPGEQAKGTIVTHEGMRDVALQARAWASMLQPGCEAQASLKRIESCLLSRTPEAGTREKPDANAANGRKRWFGLDWPWAAVSAAIICASTSLFFFLGPPSNVSRSHTFPNLSEEGEESPPKPPPQPAPLEPEELDEAGRQAVDRLIEIAKQQSSYWQIPIKDAESIIKLSNLKGAQKRYALTQLTADPVHTAELRMVIRRLSADHVSPEWLAIESELEKDPALALPPDPTVCKMLTRVQHHAWSIKDFGARVPLASLLSDFSKATGIAVVIDPAIQTNAIIPTEGGLPGSPSSASSLLSSYLSNPNENGQLDYAVHGHKVIVTTVAYAKRLRLVPYALVLPKTRNGKGESYAWDLRDSSSVAEYLTKRSGEHLFLYPWGQFVDVLENVRIDKPGRLTLLADYRLREVYETWMDKFMHPALEPIPMNDVEKACEVYLDEERNLELKDKDLKETMDYLFGPIPHFTNSFANAPRYSINKQRVTLRQFLPEFFQNSNLRATFSGIQIVIESQQGSFEAMTEFNVLDLWPALNAGASKTEIGARLEEIRAEAQIQTSCLVIRGLWIGEMDRYTQRRAVAILQEAAKTGKVPPAPRAPWFFKTLRQKE